jgi:thioredoxin 1
MAEEPKAEGSVRDCGGGGRGPGRWIWIVLVLAVVGVLFAKQAGKKKDTVAGSATPVLVQTNAPAAATPAPAGLGKAMPRLVDLGAGKCIPCKMMAPILDELKKTYAGKLEVVFIDVWENRDAGKQYGINLIPTQIFYDAQGKEIFRHEGFFAKEDILAKWKEFGVDLTGL